MNYIFSICLIFGVLNGTWLVDINEDKDDSLPLALIPAEENESEDDSGVTKQGLSSKELSDIFDLSKNISHSKGAYQENKKKDGDKSKIRRSILRKATISSESETMRAIIEIFDSTEEKLELLEHMEYLVHQYDVAVSFANMGGMKIIRPLLFSADDKIASTAALVLGAAMQSNPDVQRLAMIQNIGKSLLELLSHKSPTVLSRIIFALSSFLRNAPEAQQEFLSSNGVSKLQDILNSPSITTDIKLKIINLFNDLAVEWETADHYQKEKSTKDLVVLQRLFASEIKKNGICKHVSSFLSFEDYDTHQKIVAAMLSLNQVCWNDFKNEVIKNRLNKMIKIYEPASKVGPWYPFVDEDLKVSLYTELQELIEKIYEKSSLAATEYSLKSEL